jgi:hypothetical protein
LQKSKRHIGLNDNYFLQSFVTLGSLLPQDASNVPGNAIFIQVPDLCLSSHFELTVKDCAAKSTIKKTKISFFIRKSF